MGKAKIKPSIHRIKPYSPGVSTHDTGTPLVKMSSNENPYGPSPQAVEAVKRGSDSINLYPDKEARRLRESLSQLLGIPREAIWVGNGSDDVLQNLAKLYLSEGDNLVTHSPFSTYNTVAASMGAERKLVRMPPDAGIDVEALERACDDRTRIVVVCTPNNPTGAILEPGSMQDILGFTEAHGICLVVDEAYADFSDRYESPIRMLVEDDLDVVVTRTFSKAYGLAGLRIGFGVARPEVVRYLDLVGMPFNASSIAQEAAIAAIRDTDHLNLILERIKRDREALANRLSGLGLQPLPSEANFIMASVARSGMNASEFTAGVLENGYAIRDCTSFGFPDHVRITVGTPEMNAGLLEVIRSIVG
jgi:histidinol-phosphate aminotransferase